MDWTGLLADQLGSFTRYDILGVLLGMLIAGGLGYLLGLVARSDAAERRNMTVLAAVIALAVALVRASVPLSIALVAVALLLRREPAALAGRPFLLRLCAVAIGVGCGSSAGLIVLAAFVPLAFLLRWAFGKE